MNSLARAAAALALGAGSLAGHASAAAARAQPEVVVRPLGGVRPDAAALLARGGEGGPVRLQAIALPVACEGAALPVLLVVELDGATLVGSHPGGVLGVELTAYALDPAGRVGAARVEGIAVDLGRRGEELASGGVRWIGSLTLAPGDWSVRVLARVRQTGAFGLRQLRLGLATPRQGSTALLAIAAPASGRLLEVRSPALDPAVAGALETLGGAPSALPVLAAEASTRLWALVCGDEPGPLAARLVDGLGRPAGTPLVSPRGGRRLGLGVTALDLELAPAGGAPGLRDLVLAAPRAGVESAPHRLVVRPGAAAPTWYELARVAIGAREEATAQVTPIPAASKRDRERFQTAFREAWKRYASGDRAGGVASLQTFEVGALAAQPKRAMGWLDQSDRALLKEALERHPAATLPLALFYRDLFRAHLASGRIGLARRAELRLEGLLLQLAAAGGSEEERRVAAAAIEDFAADLLEVNAPNRAAELLEHVSRLSPERVESRLALAVLFERDHRFDEAQRVLEAALAAAPRHRELRLRRARIERLVGNADRGARQLAALVAEPVADWIGVVAVEELVRADLAAGDLDAATTRLESAVGRWPQEPSLAVVLAYAYERSGRRADARAAGERAAAASGAFGLSPRKRYGELPVALLTAGRSAVETAGLARFGDLAAAAEPG